MPQIEPKTGYVALIDVLGFRELVGRADNLDEVKAYVEVVQSLTKVEGSQLEVVVFSDNIVINTRADTDVAFRELVVTCSNLMFALIQKKIAIRGAIAHGLFLRSQSNDQGTVVAGRPIVDADYYQHQQDWVGIMLTPSTVRNIPDLPKMCRASTRSRVMAATPGTKSGEQEEMRWISANLLATHLQPWPRIPFHGSAQYEGYAVVPIPKDAHRVDQVTKSFGEVQAVLNWMKAGAPSPEAQSKYSNTVTWLSHVHGTWAAATSRWD